MADTIDTSKAPPAFAYYSLDEVAETVSGIRDNTYAELWRALGKAEEEGNAKPIYKLFDPAGSGTWLVCSLEDDNDTLWVVGDIGQDVVEYGPVSLYDLETSRGPRFGTTIERDKYFTGVKMSIAELCSLTTLQHAR